MRRIQKRDITVFVLTVCLLVVADPFLQSGLVKAEAHTINQEIADLGDITPDNIAELLNRLTGIDTGTSGDTTEETKENIVLTPSVTNPEDEEVWEDGEDFSSNEAADAEDLDETEAEEEPEESEELEDADISRQAEAILYELETNGSYTFDWYGTPITLTYADYLYLCKLIQRETVGEDLEGRIMVVNVVFNRVQYKGFPNTVVKVINQKYQFSPVTTGTIKTAKPDKTTIKAVLYAMSGIDYSQGALYFKMRDYNCSSFNNMKKIFSHGCHSFYR